MIVIAETQAARTDAPSCAPPSLIPPAAGDDADHAPAVLSVLRPGSIAGFHLPGVPTQRGALRVLPIGPAQWFRGLVNPRYLHLLETEDGQPRTLDVNGHPVGIAVCRAWLTGVALDIDTAVPAGVLVCGSCGAVAADLDRLRNHVGNHLRDRCRRPSRTRCKQRHIGRGRAVAPSVEPGDRDAPT